VLAGEMRANHLRVKGLSLQDNAINGDLGFPIATARKSKIGYVLKAMAAIRNCDHFITDAAQIGQLGWLPFISPRPILSFLCGIEVWENARSRYLRALRRARMLLAISEYTRNRADLLHGGFARAHVCWLGTESDLPAPHPDPPPQGGKEPEGGRPE